MEEREPLLSAAASPPVTYSSVRPRPATTSWWPVEGCVWKRHVLALMGFLGFANVYAMRVNLSVAIVAMVNSTAVNGGNSSGGGTGNVTGACPVPDDRDDDGDMSGDTDGPFAWSEEEQGWILGSFFYGYVLTQLPGGRLAELVGGKWLYGAGVLATAVLTLLTPAAAKSSLYLFVMVRILEGLGEGVTFPAMHAMLAQWTPPMERSKMGSRVYSGAQFGTVVSLPLSGLLCDRLGWESVFYVFGAVGVVWFFFWCFLVYDSPADHPTISSHEKAYIETSITCDLAAKRAPVPWRAILTSAPVWALTAAHVANNWGLYTFLMELPTYMKNILNFDIKEDAFASSLPYFLMWVFALGASNVADFLLEMNYATTTRVRKVFNSLATYLPAALLVLVSYTGCDVPVTLCLLTAAVGCNGASYSGYMANHLDLASNFAGTLLGITNGLANICGFLAPTIIGYIISGREDLQHWRLVFFISAIVYVVGNTLFVVFGTGREQPWNRVQEPEEEQNLEEQNPEPSQGSDTSPAASQQPHEINYA